MKSHGQEAATENQAGPRGFPADTTEAAEFLCLSHFCLPNLSSNIKSVPRTRVQTEIQE